MDILARIRCIWPPARRSIIVIEAGRVINFMLIMNLVWACGSMNIGICSNKYGSLFERGCWRFLFFIVQRTGCGAAGARAGVPRDVPGGPGLPAALCWLLNRSK